MMYIQKACLFLSCVLLWTSCQKNDLKGLKQQGVRINIQSEPLSLDPRKSRDLTSISLMHMFFEGLTRTSKTGNVELALAQSVDLSDDGLQYCFHLRKSYWSNGDRLTSFDFAESWRAILDPRFPTDIAEQLYGIKNGKKAKLGVMDLGQVGIKTPDEMTLIVELERPIPYFLTLLTMPSFFPVHQKSALENSNWAHSAEGYVCNGPFLLRKWDHSNQITAVKNPHYWQAKEVKIEEMELAMIDGNSELQLFEAGQLDWAGSPLSTLPIDAVRSLKESSQFHKAPFSATYFFRANTAEKLGGKKNPLSRASFRKALAYSIDRQAIADHLLQGGQTPARSLVPPEMGLSEKGYFREDHAEQATAFLMDALLELDLTLQTLDPIRISYVNGDRNAAIAQAIQKNWENALGIRVELEAVESKIYFQKVAQRDYQLAAGSWTADFNDPINFLEVFKYKEGSRNNTNWENSKYIDLLNQSELCRDLDERRKLLREAEQILMAQFPIIPVFHFALNFLQNSSLEGVVLSPSGQIDFRWAEVHRR